MEHERLVELAAARVLEEGSGAPVGALLRYLESVPDATLLSGAIPAADFLGIWRSRHDSCPGLQRSWRGWPDFFHALEQAPGTVLAIAVRGPQEEPARFIVIVSTESERILACLARADPRASEHGTA